MSQAYLCLTPTQAGHITAGNEINPETGYARLIAKTPNNESFQDLDQAADQTTKMVARLSGRPLRTGQPSTANWSRDGNDFAGEQFAGDVYPGGIIQLRGRQILALIFEGFVVLRRWPFIQLGHLLESRTEMLVRLKVSP